MSASRAGPTASFRIGVMRVGHFVDEAAPNAASRFASDELFFVDGHGLKILSMENFA
jgi:hypothetical protein